MPHQRTITVYERIPLDEIKDELGSDEYAIACVINEAVAEARETLAGGFYLCQIYSWDEVLMQTDQELAISSLQQKCVDALFEGECDTSSYAYRLFFYRNYKKVNDLLVDSRFRAVNPLALRLWLRTTSYGIEINSFTRAWETIKVRNKRERSSIGKNAIGKRYENDDKQKAKALIRQHWDILTQEQKKQRYKAGFARKMQDRFPIIENPVAIERWCRAWEKENCTK